MDKVKAADPDKAPGSATYAPGTARPVDFHGGGAWVSFDVGGASSAWHLPGGMQQPESEAAYAAWRDRCGWERIVVGGKPQPRLTMFFDRVGRRYGYGGCVVKFAAFYSAN